MGKELRIGQNLHTKTAQPRLDHITYCVSSCCFFLFGIYFIFGTKSPICSPSFPFAPLHSLVRQLSLSELESAFVRFKSHPVLFLKQTQSREVPRAHAWDEEGVLREVEGEKCKSKWFEGRGQFEKWQILEGTQRLESLFVLGEREIKWGPTSNWGSVADPNSIVTLLC